MSNFTQLLLQWFSETPRHLPWKNHQDLYSIWLSEIIMQQTRVAYGTAYYQKFKAMFPTVFDLANADLDEVIKAWEGLGYYSRARNLHATAKVVAKELDGKFPEDYVELQTLKGIGAYTAAAMLSFGLNKPIVAIDGNAYRVLARYFGITTPIHSSKAKREFFARGQELIEQVPDKAGDFNQAIMNFGAMVCTPKSPNCETCVLSNTCFAYQQGLVQTLPVKKKKQPLKKRYFVFIILEQHGHFFVRQRREKDVWQNLYEFVQIETENEQPWADVISQSTVSKQLSQFTVKRVFDEEQTLTHQRIFAQIVWLKPITAIEPWGDYVLTQGEELSALPFPKLLQNAVNLINLDFT